MVQEAFRQLGMAMPEGARLGCIEVMLVSMSPDQAEALITAFHNGQLKEKLTKVQQDVPSQGTLNFLSRK